MGLEIEQTRFDSRDEERFVRRLCDSLPVLRDVLDAPGFGRGPTRLGMELEMSLVGTTGRPLMRNREVVEACRTDRMALELNRFNIEYNSVPVEMAGAPFTTLAAELEDGYTKAVEAASLVDGRVAMVGILPTIHEEDLGSDALTDEPRFHALSERVRAHRKAPFRVVVDGPETVDISCEDVTLEGANTSLQVHVQVPPERFASIYNAAQIATAPALALSVNSPFFVGRNGWCETRVALFRQAVDDRAPNAAWRPARVSFGHGWVRHGAHELFVESVALHPPLLPIPHDVRPRGPDEGEAVPDLTELRLHHGTVWRWNRPVYDPGNGGSLRIELRCLPSGPTVVDMAANAAFLVGLTLALASEADWMVAALPFRYAEYNFIEAARKGLDATLLWPSQTAPSPRAVPIAALLETLIEVADHGLEEAGVDADERERHLDVIRGRVAPGVTGAHWQQQAVNSRESSLGRHKALVAMLDEYLLRSADGSPVHTWG